jgi:hypothetical protein
MRITFPITLRDLSSVLVACSWSGSFINQVVQSNVDLSTVASFVFKVAVYHILCGKINFDLTLWLVAESIGKHAGGGEGPRWITELLVVDGNVGALIVRITGVEIAWKSIVTSDKFVIKIV